MGLDRLHTLTSSRAYRLRVDITAWDGKTFWAEYDRFRVGPESGNYTLSVGGYDRNSTAPDRMAFHNGMIFTTYDRDNDRWGGGNCARKGGWWYYHCFFGDPIGLFLPTVYYGTYYKGRLQYMSRTNAKPTGVYVSGGKCNAKGIVWGGTINYCFDYSFKRMTLTLIP